MTPRAPRATRASRAAQTNAMDAQRVGVVGLRCRLWGHYRVDGMGVRGMAMDADPAGCRGLPVPLPRPRSHRRCLCTASFRPRSGFALVGLVRSRNGDTLERNRPLLRGGRVGFADLVSFSKNHPRPYRIRQRRIISSTRSTPFGQSGGGRSDSTGSQGRAAARSYFIFNSS